MSHLVASLNVTKKCIGHAEKVCVEDMKPISMTEFLKTDMKLKLIKSIHLPKREGWHYRSFKVNINEIPWQAYAFLCLNQFASLLSDNPKISKRTCICKRSNHAESKQQLSS